MFSPMELHRSKEFCVRNLGANTKCDSRTFSQLLSLQGFSTPVLGVGGQGQSLEQILLTPVTQEIIVRN